MGSKPLASHTFVAPALPPPFLASSLKPFLIKEYSALMSNMPNCPLRTPTSCLSFPPQPPGGGGGFSHTLPIRVCAAQWGHDFEAPDLEQGIHFSGVF